eukprot:CAMPEP_0169201944 /NCGR_PEP_ID=MMETSP1016-20121227/10670_1 /TAXON_ID=342587 /ORGANISM="Karlodinium micrum, Strain CCMP2283" /LENGTH=70 /DNA_ID=CAMNT_0009278889 /DNA_START=252 /DNA_END=464 /DNA_ORIENTATION=+
MSTTICKSVAALSMHLVLQELPLVQDAISRPVSSVATFASMLKLALVTSTVSPYFDTSPRLLVVIPLALI